MASAVSPGDELAHDVDVVGEELVVPERQRDAEHHVHHANDDADLHLVRVLEVDLEQKKR